MNSLIIGTSDKAARLLASAEPPFLLIDDGPIASAFIKRFRPRIFDPAKSNFNPLAGMTYKRARDFATTVYTVSPQGESTLTVRNGKRALARALLNSPSRLDEIDTSDEEVKATIDDLLLSPVLRRVLCSKPNFKFDISVVAKLDRAQLGDDDAFILATLLIGQVSGQVIIPDFGFYGRQIHTSLIRQDRLVAGLNFLSEVSPTLQQALLTIKAKTVFRVTREDAEKLQPYLKDVQNPSVLVDQREGEWRGS